MGACCSKKKIVKHTLEDEIKYDLVNFAAPVVTGCGLKTFVCCLESDTCGPCIIKSIVAKSNFASVTEVGRGLEYEMKLYPEKMPTAEQIASANKAAKEKDTTSILSTPDVVYSGQDFSHWSASDYNRAYASKKVTPMQVATALLKKMKESDPVLYGFIQVDEDSVMASATESSKRWSADKPLGVLDGVPIAVKDEMNVAGYYTGVGTQFIGREKKDGKTINILEKEDSTVVSRARAAGVIIMGKSNLHEVGLGVTGHNSWYNSARNPYNRLHHTGGSSSGSACVTAAGLVPLSIGADGGGSIRIPSALCGVVGLKPTAGRLSTHGAYHVCWSVGVCGPICNNAHDTAALYMAMSGTDEHDVHTLAQPAAHLKDFSKIQDLSDLKLGIYWDWFSDCDPDTREKCQAHVKALESRGAKVVDIGIANMTAITRAHSVTIITEMAAALGKYDIEDRKSFGLDIRANLAIARSFTGFEYCHAQQVRAFAMDYLDMLFKKVDVIISPVCGMTAPVIVPASVPDGISDAVTLATVMRFAGLANFTGIPGISYPVGYDKAGLPIGIQVMGRHWEEHTLLRLANAGESMVKRNKPAHHYDVLTELGYGNRKMDVTVKTTPPSNTRLLSDQ